MKVETAEKILHVLQQARAAGINYKSLKSKASGYSQRLKDGKQVYYRGDGVIYERQGNSTEQALCAMMDYEAEADEAAKAMTPLYLKAGKLIYRVKDERRRAILNKYYLYLHSWKEIAGELGVAAFVLMSCICSGGDSFFWRYWRCIAARTFCSDTLHKSYVKQGTVKHRSRMFGLIAFNVFYVIDNEGIFYPVKDHRA